jgi:hypothetical protein
VEGALRSALIEAIKERIERVNRIKRDRRIWMGCAPAMAGSCLGV